MMEQMVDWYKIIDIAARVSSGTLEEAEGASAIGVLLSSARSSAQVETVTYDPTQLNPVLSGEFPCGIQSLDRYMSGGLRRGELAYVSGCAKDGKTTFLISLGAHLLRVAECKILHCTLEIYPPEVQQRYTESLSRTPMYRLTPEERKRLKEELRGTLVIADMVQRPTVDAIEHVVKEEHPDMLIVDYGDLVHVKSDNRFTEVGLVWENLRRIGRTYDCAVWTAGRINRTGEESESYLKAYNCDLHVVLQVNPTDASRGVASLMVAEIRRGNGRWDEIPIVYQPDVGYIGG